MTHTNDTPEHPNLIFGTMQFGGSADSAESRAMYDACREVGISHFDTAVVYNEGLAETLLGEFVKPERESLTVATKVAYTGGAGRANILAQFDASQSRLDMDYVDILYIHRWDAATDLQETFGALAELREAGKIRKIGLSNCAAWQAMKAQAVAHSMGLRIDIMQPMYNLVKRQAEVEILPFCMDQNVEIAPYSPLGGGLLTGKYARGETGRLTEDDRYAKRYGLPWMHETATAFSEIAESLGVAPATLAVAWVAAHASRPQPIISARSARQLAPSLEAASFQMSPAIYDEITSLSPAPPPATDRLDEA
jgi:aryl-alcohol dehydrogenase-like predicted oxidoreductase